MDATTSSTLQPIDLTALFPREFADGEHRIHEDAELTLYATIKAGKLIAWRVADQEGRDLQFQLRSQPAASMCEVCVINEVARCVRGGPYGDCGAEGWGWSKPLCRQRYLIPCYLIAV